MIDQESEFDAKLAAQTQADADRKAAISQDDLLAELEDVSRAVKARAEEIAVMVRMEDPSAYVAVTEYSTALPTASDAAQIEAFRLAVKALLAIHSADYIIGLFDVILSEEIEG